MQHVENLKDLRMPLVQQLRPPVRPSCRNQQEHEVLLRSIVQLERKEKHERIYPMVASEDDKPSASLLEISVASSICGSISLISSSRVESDVEGSESCSSKAQAQMIICVT